MRLLPSFRTDLPLASDPLGRFLPWLIAFMVFLAVLALAGVLAVDEAVGKWGAGAKGTLTVQIAPADGPVEKAEREDARRIAETLKVLRTQPEVEKAEAIGRDRMLTLLEPWLGDAATTADLPLPNLIDVRVAPGATLDIAALSRRLESNVPGVSVDDHRVWLDKLVRLVRGIEILAAVVLGLIFLATIGTVVFATHTGLAIHRGAIEVLHLIGAQDRYIAWQFAWRALVLGLRGGVFGLALAVPTLMLLGWLASRIEAGLLPDLTLTAIEWAVLALLPILVAAIAMTTARVTVLRTLAAML